MTPLIQQAADYCIVILFSALFLAAAEKIIKRYKRRNRISNFDLHFEIDLLRTSLNHTHDSVLRLEKRLIKEQFQPTVVNNQKPHNHGKKRSNPNAARAHQNAAQKGR